METGEKFDLVLKGSEVIDPAQGIHSKRDIGILAGKIAAIRDKIPDSRAKKVIPLTGKIVTPGLIDVHCHASHGVLVRGALPDYAGLDSGVSLICDGGSAGAGNFYAMRRFVVEPARTKMFCDINLATNGLVKMPEIRSKHDIDPAWTRQIISENRDIIKGIKLRAIQPTIETLGIEGVETAKKIASEFHLPFVMHIGEHDQPFDKKQMNDFTRAAVKLMDKGDILCHVYTGEAGGLVSADGTFCKEALDARKHGVIMDSSHGGWHLNFAVARKGIEQGFLPDVISTDFNYTNAPVTQSLLVIMSKLLNLGMTVEQVVAMTTVNAARALSEEAAWGSLKPGMPANLAIMQLVKGEFVFSDGLVGGNTLKGDMLLEPYMVFQNGEMVPCISRYRLPPS
jgi:dihydroorotase